MNSELKILEALWNLGGEAPFYTVAKTAGFSTDYARIACRTLGKNEYIDWFGSTLVLRPRGKLEVVKLKVGESDKEKRLRKEEEEAEKETLRLSKNLLPNYKIGQELNVDDGQEENSSRRNRKKAGKGHVILGY
ncbi:hypothetical protein L6250_00705 [Candidatus Parcubacteria bacterium]|nr:hypothetical protein [Patescibacteria group bacterium]MCG2688147.1 hypothetical protein [Candidatus Parcubacteria bacterium]